MNHGKKGFYAITMTCLVIGAICILSCSTPHKQNKINETMKPNDGFLEELLKQRPDLQPILQNPDSYRVQIIYTQIDRRKNNSPRFQHFGFNLNSGEYFYPASTVKLPIAVLALQKLRKLGLRRSTTMITGSAEPWQTEVYNDPTAPDCRPSVEHYIRKLLLVSDNDASNRLYEFLGQDYIHRQLNKKGFKKTEIIHRLSVDLTPEQNRKTNPVTFHDDSGRVIYSQGSLHATYQPSPRSVKLGKAYLKNGERVEEPFDFSLKNRFSLTDLHFILQSLLFPQSEAIASRFKISDSDYVFLRKYMSQLPAETVYPPYSDMHFKDTYAKFLLAGGERGELPRGVRSFNKIGMAYGFVTDAAYIVDFENNIEFMLSATIYCNSNGVFNDDIYEYETVGLPFMKSVGQAIYDYELQRPRKHRPDLSEFAIQYDK